MIDNRTFKKVQNFIYNEVGINLTDAKRALVSSRLRKRMMTLNIDNYSDYIHYVENDRSGGEIVQLFNAISTNVTHFFRENDHFIKLNELFKKALDGGAFKYRIWSAASSSGEEPYSIAMTIKDILGNKNFDVKILGTDISTKVLNMCLRGEYTEKNMEKVDVQTRTKYFTRYMDNENNTIYKIDDSLKKMMLFKRLNLSKPPFPMKGNLDVIFCRNVMIYFDDIVRSRLINEFYRLLKPGGHLFVGHSESLAGLKEHEFRLVKASVYIKD
ncbi:MAG: protein-glutamate O-methyltransferase CheR [Candidatus Marinimicrobia bacterium]|nr:protein-glutamate O-methyltransferase CheR [Candidatus Neomarinimicrobiota bacterium]